MKAEEVNKIKSYLQLHESEMVDLLKSLVNMETPSNSVLSQKKILTFINNELETLNYYCIKVNGKKTGGYLYARPKNRNKSLPIQLLVGHCDTVWPVNTLKEMPITSDKGTITGPGIYDMKVGLTQMVFAIKAIHELKINLNVTPIVLINSDEEIGSYESTSAIQRLASISDRAFILEPPLGLEGKLKTARKGVGQFKITVKGKAAHAGLDPGKGINAIVELSHQIQKLYAMNDPSKGITVNVGMIEGGISPNVVAPESKAIIDVRVLNVEDGNNITKKIHELSPKLDDVELVIEGGIGRPPMESTPRNKVLWQKAKEQGSLLGLKLEQATAGGGSDGNTTSQFTATLDGLGTPGDGAHANHEFIFKNKLTERTALLILLLTHESIN
ncbi:MAG: M20 family metallopeptidase [Flavobacteriaceae bacterium]|nr:M20 family metallopeptidase [Flavobacteriaceae bacterium]